MLGRFSEVLQNACDALAPPAPLHEDFAYYWKRLMKHYLDITISKHVPVELTNIPSHLEQLSEILSKEDEERHGKGETGPCMEYLLEHKLLELLVSFAIVDDPPGLRQNVFKFFTKFLGLKSSVAAHTAVYPSLQRLIGQCYGSPPTATEADEVKFLLTLSARIRREHHLVPIFSSDNHSLTSKKNAGRRGSVASSEASSQNSATESCSSAVDQMKSEEKNKALMDQDFPLLEALLSYLDTADSMIRVKVCQAIMLLATLPDDKLATTIAYETTIGLRLGTRLSQLCSDIPPSTDISHIDPISVSWGLDVAVTPCLSCDGCRQVASFLSCLDFCDQLLIEAQKPVAHLLAKIIAVMFFNSLFPVEALNKPLNIAILIKCFKATNSTLFNKVLCEWLVGKHKDKELPGAPSRPILAALLKNWNDSSTDLVIQTLRLFEVALERGNHHLMHCMVYCYLQERSYLKPVDHEKEEDDRDHNSSERNFDAIIKCFLNVVPCELRSCPDSKGGYEEYITESQRQLASMLASRVGHGVADFEMPPVPTSSDMLFYEGPFLRTLFESIRNIPSQFYEVNLELTAVLSRLCLNPHPCVREFLLDSTLEVCPEVTTLHSCLCLVASLMALNVTSRPGYKHDLTLTRARLLGQLTPESEEEETTNCYESVIMLEELCKELAAIAHVTFGSSRCSSRTS